MKKKEENPKAEELHESSKRAQLNARKLFFSYQ